MIDSREPERTAVNGNLRDVQASQLRYEAIFQSAVDYAIIVMGKDGLITDWNEGAIRILGWTPDEIIGHDVSAFFTPEDREAGIPEREMEHARSEGRGIDERWHLRKNGERFWANGEMMPLRFADGELQGYVKILRDRTAQRLTETKLLENEERLQMLFTASGALGWWDWNIPGNKLACNRRFAELYSVDPDRAAEGVGIEEFIKGIHPDDRAWVGDKIQDAIKTAGLFRQEYRLLQADGRIIWVLAEGRCYHDADGEPLRYPGVSIDITERKAAEARRDGLVRLGDILRDENDPDQMAYAAAQVLGESLGISRAGYGVVDAVRETINVSRDWNAPGGLSIAGLHHFRDYGSYVTDLKSGEAVRIENVDTDLRTQSTASSLHDIRVGALANVPLLENGVFVAMFFVNHHIPRVWPSEDIQFVRNVADRVRAAIERVRAEERQRMLNQELSHRLKNTLAMVQAIAAQTLRNAPDVRTAQDALSSRLVALGKTHDLLLRGNREAADVRELIVGALSAHENATRFRLSGPPLVAGSRAALSLALMVHELATNAIKYGALNTPDGFVTIEWTVDLDLEAPTVHLSWTERGGPAVTPPDKRGFGSRLIERGLAGQIGGSVIMTYRPEGLVCVLAAPLAAFMDDDLHPDRKT